ncbi:MAG: acetate--CoA ligase family protein [Candidatus Micrarchaeaceae archaeon]
MPELLDYFEGNKLLKRYGISCIDSQYVSSSEEAIAFSKRDPIVLKLISSKAIHKSKAGLVKLNLSGNEIPMAYTELAKKGNALKPYKIIAQKMAKPGIEIIVGGKTDPQFGKLILIGLGGIYVEIFKDFALRACPITKNDALDMIEQLKSKKIVTFSGKDTDMIVGILLKVSKLLTGNQKISELDLNPLIIRDGSYEAVDIRIFE